MYYDAEKLVNFCAEKKITSEQFLFCYILYTRAYPLLYKYHQEVRALPKPLLDDLLKRRFVINTSKKEELIPDHFIVTEKFSDIMKLTLAEESNELWELFPDYVTLGDKTFVGKTISPEDLEALYGKKLKTGRGTHKEVISALQVQLDGSSIGMGLKKWVETEQWKRKDTEENITAYDL